ncbi:MAG: SHOCT domain-containing protein [Aestuariivirga sp.]
MKKVPSLIPAAFLAAVVLAPGLALAQVQAAGERYGYGPGMMWDGGYGMFFGPMFMILSLVAVIAAIVFLIQWLGAGSWHGAHKPSGPAPLDILKARFARGEIDQKEFESRRKVLAE